MGDIVLKDGRLLKLTTEQSEKLGMITLLSQSNKTIRIGDDTFKLSDIVTDEAEKLKVLQTGMDLGITPEVIHKRNNKVDRLA